MSFRQLNFNDRKRIKKCLEEDKSYAQIANLIDKHRSTIYYEIKQKSSANGYEPEYAQMLTELKRNTANSLRAKYTNQDLMNEVEHQLKKKRSPKDIPDRLKKKYPENEKMWISHETIYKVVFNFKGNKFFDRLANLQQYLPRKSKKRHIRGHLNPYRAHKRYWRSIHRMKDDFKKAFGVWQIDAMHIKGGYILVCVEVFSKKTMAMPLKHLTAEACVDALQFMFSRVRKVRAIICDRGSENTQFKRIQRVLNTRVYACDPGSPWQKGLVEGTIRLLRRAFPNSYKFKDLNPRKVYEECALLNSMYRVSLNGRTANNVYRCSSSTLT